MRAVPGRFKNKGTSTCLGLLKEELDVCSNQ